MAMMKMPACSYISGTDTLKLLSINVDKNILGYPMTLYSSCIIQLHENKVQNHMYLNFWIFRIHHPPQPCSLHVPAYIFTTAQIGSLHFIQVSPLLGFELVSPDPETDFIVLLLLFYWMLFNELIEHCNNDHACFSTTCLSWYED